MFECYAVATDLQDFHLLKGEQSGHYYTMNTIDGDISKIKENFVLT